MTDPRSPEGEQRGMSRYCDYMEARVAELEAALDKARGMLALCSFEVEDESQEWLRGLAAKDSTP